MCKTAVAVKFMLVQILKRIEPEVNQTGCEHKYKYQDKEIRCRNRQVPEFQGQQAQQLVEVNGVVLVVGKVGTLVQAPLHLAIHWLPPQSRRSQPGIETSVNSTKQLKFLDQTEKEAHSKKDCKCNHHRFVSTPKEATLMLLSSTVYTLFWHS